MKISFLAPSCFLMTNTLMAREIATEEPVTISGKLSMANSFVYITTNDTLSGKGNGVELHNEPVHRFVVSEDALPTNRQASRVDELKKWAAAGKPVTLKGRFTPL